MLRACLLPRPLLLTTHFFLDLHYGRPYVMTRSSTSVLATSWAACFPCILDNTIIVSMLCSRPPPFHAFVHSTLFQARWCALIVPPTVSWFDHLSSCFIFCHCVAYPLCFVPLVWASPNEGVFCSFHCNCCGMLHQDLTQDNIFACPHFAKHLYA